MEINLNEIMFLSHKLSNIGSLIDNKFIAVIMVNGLSENYDHAFKPSATIDYILELYCYKMNSKMD